MVKGGTMPTVNHDGRFTAQRRHLLASAGATGLGTTAGCGNDNASDGQPATHDGGGNRFQSITVEGTVVEAYGANGNFYQQYPIGDYEDVLDAVGHAQDDMPRGGIVQAPPGVYQAGTQLVVEKPLTLFPNAGRISKFRDTEISAPISIEWTGGETTPIVLRGTPESPNSDRPGDVDRSRLEGATLGSFLLRPASNGEGDQAVILDGTTQQDGPGSVVLECAIEGTGFQGWGGENPVVESVGTVFEVYVDSIAGVENDGDLFACHDAEDATMGPPSGFYLNNPRIYSNPGYWAINMHSNTYGIFGGGIQQNVDRDSDNNGGAHGIRVGDAGNGAIYGTKLEGNKKPHMDGGVGIEVFNSNNGVAKIYPAAIHKYDVGVSVGGDGTGNTGTVRIDTHFNTLDRLQNGTADIKITDGGARDGTQVMCPTPAGVVDERGLQKFREGRFNQRDQMPYRVGNLRRRPDPGDLDPGHSTMSGVNYDNVTAGQTRRLEWEDGDHWYALNSDWGEYTGDGSDERLVRLNHRPAGVIVTDGSATALSVQGGPTVPLGGTLGGDVTLVGDGFEVSAGGDGFPNGDGVTYNFIVL
jgi:hypothetical protein